METVEAKRQGMPVDREAHKEAKRENDRNRRRLQRQIRKAQVLVAPSAGTDVSDGSSAIKIFCVRCGYAMEIKNPEHLRVSGQ